MSHVIETTVYKFEELTEEAKEKAIEAMSDINTGHEWWTNVYDDALNIGIKITSFDIDRASYCKGNFIDDACFTAHKVIDEHGEHCETYKTAESFLKERDEIIETAEKDENGDFVDEYELDQKLNDVEEEFLKSICEDYRINLSKEYEYLTSKEAITETIKSNDYDFTIEGEQF